MTITIRSRQATWEIANAPGERILYAGLSNAIPLPFECASGTCGTCKARVKTGEITDLWPDAPGREGLKADKGEFLMCQCTADTDLEILVPGNLPAEMRCPVPARCKGTLTITDRLVHDVATFQINLDRSISFEPGQFVVVRLPHLDGFRAYSMVNYVDTTDTLEFVIKSKPDGGFSQWLFSDAASSAEVDVFGPLGAATFSAQENRDVLCIAGGSGIAGMMSILNAALQANYFDTQSRVGHVFFGVRTLEDLFYRDALTAFVKQADGKLNVTIALSDEPANDDKTSVLNFANGFVHEVAGARMAGQFDNTTAYVAGPPPMVDGALRMLITEAKLSPQYIRYDKFA